MSQTQPSTRVLSQNQEALLKTYQKQLKDDIKSMVDNFIEIIRMNKIDDSSQILKPTQSQEDQYEMNVRAANIVRAGESLMKLVSDLKQFLILNDFTTVNEAITNNRQLFKKMQVDYDQKLQALRDDMASTLYELEEEYYSSVYK